MKAFVIMPFSEKLKNLYELVIKEACKACGVDAVRIDEKRFVGEIVNEIFKEIDDADFVIADVSDYNGNVLFELGYAFAKNKPYILLNSKLKNLKKRLFDIEHIRQIEYSDGKLNDLKENLIAELKTISINTSPESIAGLKGLYKTGNITPEFEEKLFASKEVNIFMTTGTGFIRHYRNQLIDMIASHGTKINILIANKDSGFLNDLKKIEKRDNGNLLKREIMQSKSIVEEILKCATEKNGSHQGRIIVKYFKTEFRTTLIISESIGWITLTLPPEKAIYSPSIEFVKVNNDKKSLYELANNYFKAAWNNV